MNDNQILERIKSSRQPFALACETTNICSAKCSFCAYDKGGDPRPKGKLSEETFTHLMDLVERGRKRYTLSINTILGDPTCDARWIEFIRIAHRNNRVGTIRAFTNAILLDKFGAEELLQSGLSHLTLSSSLANEEAYARIYGVPEFSRVSKNIMHLNKVNAELGKPVHINLALRMDKPYEEFFHSEFYEELKAYLSESKVSTLDTYDDWGGLVKKEHLPRGTTFIKSWIDQNNSKDRSVPCYGLYRTLQVLLDGTIQGCTCRINPDLAVGNITDFESIEDAWRNPAFEAIRQAWWDGNIPKYCRRCTHYHPMTQLVSKYRSEQPSFGKRARHAIKRIILPGRG